MRKIELKIYADMAELADAMDLESIEINLVQVQILLSAPQRQKRDFLA